MKATIGVSGKFKITVLRNDEVLESTEFQNLILDRFFTRWAAGSLTSTAYCGVGTGTLAPTTASIGLTGPVGSLITGVATTQSNRVDGADYYASTKFTFTYSTGAIVNTIGEIGISFSNSGNNYDTMTLIKDAAGNPTTITLTAQDQLIIEYFMIQRLPVNIPSSTITVNGSPVSCTIETMNVASAIAWPIWLLSNDLQYSKCYLYSGQTLHNNPATGKSTAGGTAVTLAGITSSANGTAREISFPISFTQGNLPGGQFNYIMFTTVRSAVEYPLVGLLFSPTIAKNADISLVIKLQFTMARM